MALVVTFCAIAGTAFVASTSATAMTAGLLGLAAMWVFRAAFRKPGHALVVIALIVPFQQLVLSLAFDWGVPARIVRIAGFWKEAVVVALLCAVIARHRPIRLDAIDGAVLAYVAMVAMYAAVSVFAPRAFVPWLISANVTAVMSALQKSVLFLLILLACRRLAGEIDFWRVAGAVVLAGVLIAGAGLYEFFFPESWNTFLVETLKLPRYRAEVAGDPFPDPRNLLRAADIGTRSVHRVGSIFANPLAAGLALVLPFTIAVVQGLSARRAGASGLAAAVIFLGLLVTQTRAAIVAALIAVLYLLARRAPLGMRRARPVLLGLALGGLALMVVWDIGFFERAQATARGADPSSRLHIERSAAAARRLISEPAGQGVGTGAALGRRFGTGNVVAENYYLHIGNETGVLSLGAFLLGAVLILRRSKPSARDRPSDGRSDAQARAAIWPAFLGLSVAAMFLQVWLDIVVAWPVWALLGIVVGTPRTSEEGAACPSSR